MNKQESRKCKRLTSFRLYFWKRRRINEFLFENWSVCEQDKTLRWNRNVILGYGCHCAHVLACAVYVSFSHWFVRASDVKRDTGLRRGSETLWKKQRSEESNLEIRKAEEVETREEKRGEENGGKREKSNEPRPVRQDGSRSGDSNRILRFERRAKQRNCNITFRRTRAS